jgi:hypothetical protein
VPGGCTDAMDGCESRTFMIFVACSTSNSSVHK